MNDNLYLFESHYDDVDYTILKAAIAYKYLLHVYLYTKNVTIDEILIENKYDLGLVRPGRNCMVSICEKNMWKPDLSSPLDFARCLWSWV